MPTDQGYAVPPADDILAMRCRKCGLDFQRSLFMAILEDLGASVSPRANVCSHDGGEHDWPDLTATGAADEPRVVRCHAEELEAKVSEPYTDEFVWGLQEQVRSRDDEIARLRAALDAHWRAEQQGHTDPCTYGPLCPWCELEHQQAVVEAARAKCGSLIQEAHSQWQDATIGFRLALAAQKAAAEEILRELERGEVDRG